MPLGGKKKIKSNEFYSDESGNFGILTALLIPVLLVATGLAVDVSTALGRRIDIQGAADAAVLRAAGSIDPDGDSANVKAIVEATLAANSSDIITLIGEPTVTPNQGLCIAVSSKISTAFMRIVFVNEVSVGVNSCATLPESNQVEIALVLDVSSSMTEEDRFEPMKAAVQSFLDKLSTGGNLPSNVRVSMIPFSSRVNFGMTYTSWFTGYNGQAAIPDRWRNPSSHYSSSFKISRWLDNLTALAFNGKNYYWMGCFEPRADVSMRTSGSISASSLGDGSPDSGKFVAMDSNPQSGQSFCPSPVMELTNDLSLLKANVNQITSQGSTRLDVGMIAGWYTLSPKWKDHWTSGVPSDYGASVKKYIVFMTDGAMNVQFGPSDDKSDKLDWICDRNRTRSGCNAIANDALRTTCGSIKNDGIEIYSISYSSDADVTNLRTCASGSENYYQASVTSIESVYEKIAAEISVTALRLTN
jgi:Flp pilus assembly protein TadG